MKELNIIEEIGIIKEKQDELCKITNDKVYLNYQINTENNTYYITIELMDSNFRNFLSTINSKDIKKSKKGIELCIESPINGTVKVITDGIRPLVLISENQYIGTFRKFIEIDALTYTSNSNYLISNYGITKEEFMSIIKDKKALKMTK